MGDNEPDQRRDDLFELRDYEMKLEYLTKQYDRLWTRFNFFLTVELALFGYSGYLLFDARAPQACVIPIFKLSDSLLGFAPKAHAGARVEKRGSDWRSWYDPSFSITQLPVFVAFALFVFWIFVLVFTICYWDSLSYWFPPKS